MVILADRPTLGSYGSWTGDVLANGSPQLPKRSVGYVMQQDLFFADLTVREHLQCTAALRLPAHWTEAARKAELARVVSLLRLESALDTFVGGGSTRGISGGELKRVNIGLELDQCPDRIELACSGGAVERGATHEALVVHVGALLNQDMDELDAVVGSRHVEWDVPDTIGEVDVASLFYDELDNLLPTRVKFRGHGFGLGAEREEWHSPSNRCSQSGRVVTTQRGPGR